MGSYEALVEHQKHTHLFHPEYDFLVFFGRFSPFHNSHKNVIQTALNRANYVLVLIGSVYGPREYRNPFTFEERKNYILESFPEYQDRLVVLGIEDSFYNEPNWLQSAQSLVNDAVRNLHDFESDPKIGLIGFNKDRTSFYLKKFPQWASVGVQSLDANQSATQIREAYFSNISEPWLRGCGDYIPEPVKNFLVEFKKTKEYKALRDEYEFVRDYQIQWKEVPHPVTFNTVDAVVIQSGHILLVRRKFFPGKGLWALPGGFLKGDEKIEDAMIRELREETRIHVPDAALRGSIIGNPFRADEPYRDPRGRVLSDVFTISLREGNLPDIRGSDDAEKAKWFPLSEINRSMIFLDHYDLIKKLVPRID